ncbi:MAG TPA: hypothetical protein DCF68_06755 [Cyanothece sp. UBA12306]|nr:hypothetical protein [Cyanothece sp. UBA12306]
MILFDIYVNQNQKLFLDSANVLESLVKQDSKTAIIHRLLGDMYVYLGMIAEAKRQYYQALELAKSANNLEEIAASQSGLGHISVVNQDLQEAKSLLLQAKENYTLSGKISDAELVEQWLLTID